MERVTGERFDVAMRRLVLEPLRLDACFNWGAGCSANAFRRAVVLYRASGEVARDDLHGQPPTCPVFVRAGAECDLSHYPLGANGALFSPHGGLRISMRDLARIGQLLARGGAGFLSARRFQEMTRIQWRFDGSNGLGEDGTASGFFCGYALALHTIGTGGPGCRDDLFGDGRRRIGHSGEAYGLRSGLWVDPKTGRGVAFFTSAVAPGAPTGQSAFTAAEEALVARSR
jgi:CubicO group peptidase (beta-lactamase class C family)